MPTYRVRATSRQAYTQYFKVVAATPEEALSLVEQGDIEVIDECFEHVDTIEPLAAREITHDPATTQPSASAKLAPTPTANEPSRW